MDEQAGADNTAKAEEWRRQRRSGEGGGEAHWLKLTDCDAPWDNMTI